MTMCEYDRSLLKEIKNVLYEIRDELKGIKAVDTQGFNYMVNNGNKRASLSQELLRYQLELMEEANEDEE